MPITTKWVPLGLPQGQPIGPDTLILQYLYENWNVDYSPGESTLDIPVPYTLKNDILPGYGLADLDNMNKPMMLNVTPLNKQPKPKVYPGGSLKEEVRYYQIEMCFRDMNTIGSYFHPRITYNGNKNMIDNLLTPECLDHLGIHYLYKDITQWDNRFSEDEASTRNLGRGLKTNEKEQLLRHIFRYIVLYEAHIWNEFIFL